MGAVYNRQNLKALIHFITIMGLFQLADIRPLEAFFALGGVTFYFYSIIDAYRTAKLIAQGTKPAEDEARFKRSIIRHAPALGMLLIFAGIISAIQVLRPFGFRISLIGLVPVALIVLGGYLLTSYFKRSRGDEYLRDTPSQPPYPLMIRGISDSSYESTEQSRRSGDFR